MAGNAPSEREARGSSDEDPGFVVDPVSVRKLRRFSAGSAISVAGVGAVVLLAWAINSPILKRIHPTLASMKANTALCFILSGSALYVGRRPGTRKVATILASLVTTIALLSLVEYAWGINLRIDQWLFQDLDSSAAPGRMSLGTAVHFLLLGVALLCLDVEVGPTRQRPTEWLVLLAALSSVLSSLGYLYGVRALYAVLPYASMALHTVLAFTLLELGILSARPDRGLMRLVTNDGPGGVLARRMLPAAIGISALMGWLRLHGEHAGFYDSEFGTAMFAAFSAFCFAILIASTSHALVRGDLIRRQAETALRARETDLATTLQSIGDAVIATDVMGLVTRMNPVAEKLTGWKVEDAQGLPLGQVYHALSEGSRTPVENPTVQILQGAASANTPHDGLLVCRDGTEYAISDRAAPIRDADGEVRGVVLVFRDMTDARHAEDALCKVEEQLRQAQKMEAIGVLAGGVAHDFNNLLFVILGYAFLMETSLNAGEAVLRVPLQEISRAGNRAVELTRQLLAFSRQQVMQPKVVDLNEVVDGASKMLSRVIGEDVELTLLPAFDLGKVLADPGQIDQVLMNLAVNARDAMPRGGKLTIATANIDLDEGYARDHIGATAGPHVMLSVSDTGCGMDSATQLCIFEPFFTTKEIGRGTGLGLSTVFGIVRQSGGTIRVYSELGKGTTFKLYFPRTEQADVRAPRLVPSKPVGGSETVLVVEDDEQVRNLVGVVLRQNGYHVLTASNAGDALLIREQHGANIHLLLTDVVMPRMSGRELSERLALLRPSMKVLYMSGHTNDSVVHHGVLDSTVAFVEKPLMPTALLTHVRAVLDC